MRDKMLLLLIGLGTLCLGMSAHAQFGSGYQGYGGGYGYSPASPARRRPDTREWWEKAQLGRIHYRTSAVNGSPVPKGATMYYYEPMPENYQGVWEQTPRFLYPGESMRQKLGHEAPPHLYVHDPRELPPVHPAREYSGLQDDLLTYHGTDVRWTVPSATLRDLLPAFWEGKDVPYLAPTSSYGISVNGVDLGFDFQYQVGDRSYAFDAPSLENIRRRFQAHVKAAYVEPRLAKFTSVVNKINGQVRPLSIAPQELVYPFVMNRHLNQQCGDYQFSVSDPDWVRISYGKTPLAKVPFKKLSDFRFRCHGAYVLIQASELAVEQLGLQNLAKGSNVKLANDKAYRHTGAIFVVRGTDLIAARTQVPGTKYNLDRSVSLDPKSGLLFSINVQGANLQLEVGTNGALARRPQLDKWRCEGASPFRLQYVSDYQFALTRLESGGERSLGEIEGLQEAHCVGNRLAFLAYSFRPGNAVAQIDQASNVSEQPSGAIAGEEVTLYLIDGDKLRFAYENKEGLASSVNWQGEKAILSFSDQKDAVLEVSAWGKNRVLRPISPLRAEVQKAGYDLRISPMGSLEVTFAAVGQGEEALVRVEKLESITPVPGGIALSASAIYSEPALDKTKSWAASETWEPAQSAPFVVLSGKSLAFVRSSKGVEAVKPSTTGLMLQVADSKESEELVFATKELVVRPQLALNENCIRFGYRLQRRDKQLALTYVEDSGAERLFIEMEGFGDLYCTKDAVFAIAKAVVAGDTLLSNKGQAIVFWAFRSGKLKQLHHPHWFEPASIRVEGSKLEVGFVNNDAVIGFSPTTGNELLLKLVERPQCEKRKVALRPDGIVSALDTKGKPVWFGGLRSFDCLPSGEWAVLANERAETEADIESLSQARGTATRLWIEEVAHTAADYGSVRASQLLDETPVFRLASDRRAPTKGIGVNGEELFPRNLSLESYGSSYGGRWVDVNSLAIYASPEAKSPLVTLNGVESVSFGSQSVIALTNGVQIGSAKTDSLRKSLISSPPNASEASQALVLLVGEELRLIGRPPKNKKFGGLKQSGDGFATRISGESSYEIVVHPEGWIETEAFSEKGWKDHALDLNRLIKGEQR